MLVGYDGSRDGILCIIANIRRNFSSRSRPIRCSISRDISIRFLCMVPSSKDTFWRWTSEDLEPSTTMAFSHILYPFFMGRTKVSLTIHNEGRVNEEDK